MTETCLTVDEFESIQRSAAVFETLSQWIRQYLAEPHRELGRGGTVCPYAPTALRRDALRLAVIRLGAANRFEHIVEAVLRYKGVFQRLRDENESDRVLQAIIVAFPDVSLDEAPALIDGPQRSLKSRFVRDGLMLGEFHARNSTPGLHNSAFHPLRSPVPLLAIRHMVPSDLVFLCRPDDPAEVRAEYLGAYLACLNGLTPAERALAQRFLDAALAETHAAASHG